MSSLLASFFIDRQYKRTLYAITAITSILYFSISLLAWHRENVRVTCETAFLSCLVLAVGILLRSRLRRKPLSELTSPAEPSGLLFVCVAFLIGIAIVGITQSSLVVRVQAKVIDARFRGLDEVGRAARYADPEAHLRSRFQRLESIADTSYRYQIPVNSSTLADATREVKAALVEPKRLSESTKEAGWMAYGNLISLEAVQATKQVQPLGYVISSPFLLTDTKVHFVGEHSASLVLGDTIVIQRSTILFDGIDFQTSQPFLEALFVDSSSTVVVRNAVVTNLSQTLDAITWINVEFRHSMIKVNGGPFTLVNVKFVDCDLRWLPPSGPLGGQMGLELRQRISRANGQPITFAYQGTSLTTAPKPE